MVRLQGKAMLKTNHCEGATGLSFKLGLVWLFQTGIRLHVQFFRAVENDLFALPLLDYLGITFARFSISPGYPFPEPLYHMDMGSI